MKRSFLCSVLVAILGASSLIADGIKIGEGKYISTLSSKIDEKTADKIEARLDKIEELTLIDVKPKDSTVWFTVKHNAQVDLARLNDAVKSVAPNESLSAPVLQPATSHDLNE